MSKSVKTMALRIVVSAAVILVLLALSCAPPVGREEKMIKIGLNVAVTGGGASSSAPLSWGAVDYVRYVSDELVGIEYRDPETGETEMARLDVRWGDNGYNVARSISVYKRQSAAGTVAMWVISGSMASGLLAFIEREQMPIVTVSGALPLLLTEPPVYVTSYSVTQADTLKGVMALVKKIWPGMRPPRLGVAAYESVEAREGFTDPTLDDYAKSVGVEYLGAEWLPIVVTDSTIELTRLMAKEADYIYCHHVIGMLSVILKDAMRMGRRGEVNFLASPYATDEAMISLAPEAMEGVYPVAYAALTGEKLPGVELSTKVMHKYGHEPSHLTHAGTVTAMVLIQGLKLSLEKVGIENLTGTIINDSIQALTDFDVGGLCPPITVTNREYPVLNPYLKAYQIRGGKIEPVSDWVESPMTYLAK